MRGTITATGLLLAAAACLAQPSADWPQWRGPNRDGITTGQGIKPWDDAAGPKVLWRAAVGRGYSSLVVAEGRAFAMGNAANEDTVFCFRAESGEALWKHTYPCLTARVNKGQSNGGPFSTPLVADGKLYTLSREGHLFCFEAATGKVLWSEDLQKTYRKIDNDWGAACSPLLLDNKLIVEIGTVLALDKDTGKLIWKALDEKPGYSSPAIVDVGKTRCLAVFTAAGLSILDGPTGRKLMSYPWPTQLGTNAATPLVLPGKIFLSSGFNVSDEGGGSGCAMLSVEEKGLRLLWKNQNLRTYLNTAVFYKDHLYGVDNSRLRCLDADGQMLWNQNNVYFGTSVTVVDDRLLILTENGWLILAEASPKGFTMLAKSRILGEGEQGRVLFTPPAIAGGRAYCRDLKGNVVCLDLKGSP